MRFLKKSFAMVLSLVMVLSLGLTAQAAETIKGKAQVGKTYKTIVEKCDVRSKNEMPSITIRVKATASGTAILSGTTDSGLGIFHVDSKTGDSDYGWYDDNVKKLSYAENKDGSCNLKSKIKIKKGEIYSICAGGFGGCVYKLKLNGKGKVKFKVIETTGWECIDWDEGASDGNF